MYQLSPGELHQHQHCVQHKPPDQAEAEDRQDHEAPDCHPLSVPHIRVPSGEKFIFSDDKSWYFKEIFHIMKLRDSVNFFLQS